MPNNCQITRSGMISEKTESFVRRLIIERRILTMRTFAQKLKATQQTRSAKSTLPGRAQLGQSREVSSILHLQRLIGNQAVQRLLEANTRDVKGDSTTEIARFGHDFSRIPVHAATPMPVQPRVTTGAPWDHYDKAAHRRAGPARTADGGEPRAAAGAPGPLCRFLA